MRGELDNDLDEGPLPFGVSFRLFSVFGKESQKRSQKISKNVSQMGSQKGAKIVEMRSQNDPQKRVPKKASNMIIFWTPECSQSVVNSSKIDDFQVLVLSPFWVSFWMLFGVPNRSKTAPRDHFKSSSKKCPQKGPKSGPKGLPKGSLNRQK